MYEPLNLWRLSILLNFSASNDRPTNRIVSDRTSKRNCYFRSISGYFFRFFQLARGEFAEKLLKNYQMSYWNCLIFFKNESNPPSFGTSSFATIQILALNHSQHRPNLSSFNDSWIMLNARLMCVSGISYVWQASDFHHKYHANTRRVEKAHAINMKNDHFPMFLFYATSLDSSK